MDQRLPDTPEAVAFSAAAPAAEAASALAQLQRDHVPTGSSLLDQGLIRTLADEIQAAYDDQWAEMAVRGTLAKAIGVGHENSLFRSAAAKRGDRGMQSVRVDDLQVSVMAGGYWERPGGVQPAMMRQMVEQTPVLNAIIMTRQRQLGRFCQVSTDRDIPGFEIVLEDGSALSGDARAEAIAIQRFLLNCGWEANPMRRKRLRRDSFAQFMAKSVRDSLTMDSAGIELEWRRNRDLGLDGFYAVDGATLRLCTEYGYEGDDEIFALQVVDGRVCTAYAFDELIYEPRNPRADVRACGYGISEVELLVRVVTGLLNAMSYNIQGFDSNAIPKGMLHLTGNYTQQDIAAFKRYWNSMVRGVNNSWALPVMVSKDQESKASFERFGVEYNEMYFAKWMTFLTSICCAIYGMSPAEINFDSFTAGSTSALAGSDTAEKLAASKDSGLVPLMSYYQGLFTEFVVPTFGDRWAFRWTGLRPADAEKKHELRKLVSTVDELRAFQGLPKHPDETLGAAPANESLLALYQQGLQQQGGGEDFGGDPSGAGAAGPDDGQQAGDGAHPVPGQDFGGGRDDGDFGDTHDAGFGTEAAGDFGDRAQGKKPAGDFGKDDGDFGKALPAIYSISLGPLLGGGA